MKPAPTIYHRPASILRLALVLFFVILLLVFASCKKYPDGPGISLRTKASRVYNTWQVTQFSINGDNQLKQVVQRTAPTQCGAVVVNSTRTCTSYTWQFKKGGAQSRASVYSIVQPDNAATAQACAPVYQPAYDETATATGTWVFTNNKTQLLVQDSTTRLFDILELRNDQIKLQGTVNGQFWTLTLHVK